MDDKFTSIASGHVDVAELDFENRDDHEMAMLEKKQQLKVRSAHYLPFNQANSKIAEFQLHEHDWNFLYNHGHLGEYSGVCSELKH